VKRALRLLRPEQFQRVRREGQVFNHPLVRLNVAPNRHRQQVRCGFVVSKHVGKAVQRNRAKRRMREAVRLMLHHVARGVDLVFVIRTHEVAEVPFPHLQSSIEQLLHRAGIWVDDLDHQPSTTKQIEE